MAFWDDEPIRALGKSGDMYKVIQVVLTERFLGTGSGTQSLTNLQSVLNEQAALGYKLHTITTTASGSKGFLGGDKIQATMVFEKVVGINVQQGAVPNGRVCSNCGQQLKADALFCNSCGTKI